MRTAPKWTWLLAAPLLVTACGMDGPAHKAPAANAAATVEMGLANYSEESVTIRAGQTVEWRNTSVVTHSVTDVPRLAQKKRDALLPAGAQAFNSGDIEAGNVYQHTFPVVGTYRYFCTHHEDMGMVATVIVKPAM